MGIVIDASAVVGLAFVDEDSSYAEGALRAVRSASGAVPTLFWFEVRNVLVMGERRGRVTPEGTAAVLNALATLPVQVDPQPDEAAVLDLARSHKLTVYDAAYLELARRRGFQLATLDRELRAAAPAVGVTVWTP